MAGPADTPHDLACMLSEAAGHLGIKQSTLVTQVNRLERDPGGPLLERADRGQPMSLTPLGKQVLTAFTRPAS